VADSSSAELEEGPMAESFVELGTKPNRVLFGGSHEIEDDFLYECFSQIPASEYEDAFKKFLVVGAYAWREERLAAFFRKVEDEVEGRLEELKVLYKTRTLREKATTKGTAVERDAATVLQEFIDEQKWQDEVTLTGESVGVLPRRKVGDLVVDLVGYDRRVVIESKMDASVLVGDPTTLDGAGKASHAPEKTAYGQNLTALVNRQADVSIIIFDKNTSSATVKAIHDKEYGLRFNPEIPAFVAIIDVSRDDWSNLFLAYSLARSIALLGDGAIEHRRIELVVKRIVRDLGRVKQMDNQVGKAEKAANETLKALGSLREVSAAAAESANRSLELVSRVVSGQLVSGEEWKKFFDESD
jgi:hypothetical protein